MPSIQELAIKLNGDVVQQLIRNVRAMPEDKVTWQPLDTGRTTLSQLQECAIICGFTIQTLKTHAIPADFQEAYGKELGEIDTTDKAAARLEERASELSAVILSMPDSDLEKTVQLPWSPEPASLAEMMFMNYWNTAYHIGQISYIQTLYGDNEMH
jgi:hypothetical protein